MPRAFADAFPPFRHDNLIIYVDVDVLCTVPLADLLHAYQLNHKLNHPERLKVDFHFAGNWAGFAVDLKLTGTVEIDEDEVPDYLIDVDPAKSHLASTVKVMRMLEQETRDLFAAAKPWEPTAEQEPASEMFWRYCEGVVEKLPDMSVKDALHSTSTD